MKVKKISLLLVLMLAVTSLFTACSDGSGPKKETADGQSDPIKNAVFALNETAVFENTKITAKQFKEIEPAEYFEPEEGKKFVGVEFEVENIGDEDISVSSMMSFNAYADDVKLEYSLNAACAVDNTMDGELAPGKKMIGWYAMEVPEDCKKVEVQYLENILDDSENSATFVFEE